MSLTPIALKSIECPHSVEMAMRKLQAIITDEDLVNRGTYFYSSSRPWTGKIIDKRFRLRRIIKEHRISFMPRVRGRVSETDKGSVVRLRLFLHPFTMFLFLFWTLGSLITLIYFFSQQYARHAFSTDLLKPAAMLVGGWFLFMLLFHFECRKVIAEFRNALD